MAEVLNAADDSTVFGHVILEVEDKFVEDLKGLVDLGMEALEVSWGLV